MRFSSYNSYQNNNIRGAILNCLPNLQINVRKESKMKIIGITGASGSGKTTISQKFNQRKDTKVIDADKIVKEMAKPNTPYLLEIQKTFQKEAVIFENGTLNRPKLAQLIYKDEESLKKLNRITFNYLIPRIVEEIKNVSADIQRIVIDAPLLFEAHLDEYCDFTVALYVPDELKIKRICARDKISENVAKDRLKIQKSNEFYKQKADCVIINDENTSLQDLEEQVEYLVSKTK